MIYYLMDFYLQGMLLCVCVCLCKEREEERGWEQREDLLCRSDSWNERGEQVPRSAVGSWDPQEPMV